MGLAGTTAVDAHYCTPVLQLLSTTTRSTSNSSTVTLATPPITTPEPALNLAAPQATGGAIDLTWDEPADNGGSALDSYSLYQLDAACPDCTAQPTPEGCPPQVVTNGLTLHLDASDRASYAPGANTWNDLSGANRHAAMTGNLGVWHHVAAATLQGGDTLVSFALPGGAPLTDIAAVRILFPASTGSSRQIKVFGLQVLGQGGVNLGAHGVAYGDAYTAEAWDLNKVPEGARDTDCWAYCNDVASSYAMNSYWQSGFDNLEHWLAIDLGRGGAGQGHVVQEVAARVDLYGWVPEDDIQLQVQRVMDLNDAFHADGGGSFQLNMRTHRTSYTGSQWAGAHHDVDGRLYGQRFVVPPSTAPVVPASSTPSARTLEAWVKVLHSGRGLGFLLNDDLAHTGLAAHHAGFGRSDNEGRVAAVRLCSAPQVAQTGPPLHEWVQMVATFADDGNTTLYVDGEQVGSHWCNGSQWEQPDPLSAVAVTWRTNQSIWMTQVADGTFEDLWDAPRELVTPFEGELLAGPSLAALFASSLSLTYMTRPLALDAPARSIYSIALDGLTPPNMMHPSTGDTASDTILCMAFHVQRQEILIGDSVDGECAVACWLVADWSLTLLCDGLPGLRTKQPNNPISNSFHSGVPGGVSNIFVDEMDGQVYYILGESMSTQVRRCGLPGPCNDVMVDNFIAMADLPHSVAHAQAQGGITYYSTDLGIFRHDDAAASDASNSVQVYSAGSSDAIAGPLQLYGGVKLYWVDNTDATVRYLTVGIDVVAPEPLLALPSAAIGMVDGFTMHAQRLAKDGRIQVAALPVDELRATWSFFKYTGQSEGATSFTSDGYIQFTASHVDPELPHVAGVVGLTTQQVAPWENCSVAVNVMLTGASPGRVGVVFRYGGLGTYYVLSGTAGSLPAW